MSYTLQYINGNPDKYIWGLLVTYQNNIEAWLTLHNYNIDVLEVVDSESNTGGQSIHISYNAESVDISIEIQSENTTGIVNIISKSNIKKPDMLEDYLHLMNKLKEQTISDHMYREEQLEYELQEQCNIERAMHA